MNLDSLLCIVFVVVGYECRQLFLFNEYQLLRAMIQTYFRQKKLNVLRYTGLSDRHYIISFQFHNRSKKFSTMGSKKRMMTIIPGYGDLALCSCSLKCFSCFEEGLNLMSIRVFEFLSYSIRLH